MTIYICLMLLILIASHDEAADVGTDPIDSEAVIISADPGDDEVAVVSAGRSDDEAAVISAGRNDIEPMDNEAVVNCVVAVLAQCNM